MPAIGWERVRVRWPSSVRSRATIGATVILAIALAIGSIASAVLLQRALTSDAQSQLIDRVDEVEGLIASGLPSRPSVEKSVLHAVPSSNVKKIVQLRIS